MTADDWDRLAQFATLLAVLVLIVVVVWGQKAREESRNAAVVRIQACVVQMLLVDAESRAEMTVGDFERMCPGVRAILEEENDR